MKILFDTNVYVSESLVGGLAVQIIEAAINARWRIFTSTYILDEAERVLAEKLGFGPRFGSAARQRIRRRTELVHAPPSRHRVPNDPTDNPILQAALATGVDYLVTDDRHLLVLHPYEGIAIVPMRDFAMMLRNEGMLPPE